MLRTLIDAWRCFLDSLDTDGGHIVILCAFVLGGVWLFARDATAGGQIITGAWAALLVLLNRKGSNRQQLAQDAPPPVAPVAPPPASQA